MPQSETAKDMLLEVAGAAGAGAGAGADAEGAAAVVVVEALMEERALDVAWARAWTRARRLSGMPSESTPSLSSSYTSSRSWMPSMFSSMPCTASSKNTNKKNQGPTPRKALKVPWPCFLSRPCTASSTKSQTS